jgi:hypothetical protein
VHDLHRDPAEPSIWKYFITGLWRFRNNVNRSQDGEPSFRDRVSYYAVYLPHSISTHQLLTYFTVLEPFDIVNLQLVNQKFLKLGRDDTLWKDLAFTHSSFLRNLRRRQEIITSQTAQESPFRDLARALATGNGQGDSRLLQPRKEARDLKARSIERNRILANWDPSYPNEKVNWYDEYIARNAPIKIGWLQQPRNRESPEHEHLEVRGLGLYTPPGEDNSTFAVAPLDDGSVCLWDITGRNAKKGSIIARSKSGVLSSNSETESNKRSRMISTGITECVSVDSMRKRAYIAVQSRKLSWNLRSVILCYSIPQSPLYLFGDNG